MGYEAKGKICSISATAQVSERFSKREFVVEMTDNPKYPQFVQFELTGDRCAQLDGFNEGDDVAIEFSIRGRKWDGPKGTKYFVSLDVWQIRSVGQPRRQVESSRAAVSSNDDANNDIPF